jgi:hypothetical protein
MERTMIRKTRGMVMPMAILAALLRPDEGGVEVGEAVDVDGEIGLVEGVVELELVSGAVRPHGGLASRRTDRSELWYFTKITGAAT